MNVNPINHICHEYFNAHKQIKNWDHHSTKTKIVVALSVLSYFTIIIPLCFLAIQKCSSLIGRVQKKETTQKDNDLASKILNDSDSQAEKTKQDAVDQIFDNASPRVGLQVFANSLKSLACQLPEEENKIIFFNLSQAVTQYLRQKNINFSEQLIFLDHHFMNEKNNEIYNGHSPTIKEILQDALDEKGKVKKVLKFNEEQYNLLVQNKIITTDDRAKSMILSNLNKICNKIIKQLKLQKVGHLLRKKELV